MSIFLCIAVLVVLAVPASAFMPPACISGHVYIVDGDDKEFIEDGHVLMAEDGDTNPETDIVGGYYEVDVKLGIEPTIKLFVDGTHVKTVVLEGSETVDIYLEGDLEPMTCVENWSCTSWSEWSDCEEDEQTRTRTCTDLNECGTTNSKPALVDLRDCGDEPETPLLDSPNKGGGGSSSGGGGSDDDDELDTEDDEDIDEDDKELDEDSTPVGKVTDAEGTGITGAVVADFITEPSTIIVAGLALLAGIGIYFYLKK